MADFLDESNKPIVIKVDYYDENERQKLLKYFSSEKIEAIVSKGISIEQAQFYTYYLYHKRRPGKQGYRNYSELSKKIKKSVEELEDWVSLENGILNYPEDVTPQLNAITERIGEAAALSVMGEIHGLHEADWDRIPEKAGNKGIPTFDFERIIETASDGEHIVQVEAKGSCVDNSTAKEDSVRQQKHKIKEKKKKIKELELDKSDAHKTALRYGVITAIGKQGSLQCWLTDPFGNNDLDARRYKLLARMQFIYDWVSFLSPRSQIATSLATRLQALNLLKDPFELAGVPLLKGNGKKFNYSEIITPRYTDGTFLNLCRVVKGPAIGTVIPLKDEKLFFLGVQRRLFKMAAAQNFDEILKYKEKGGSVFKKIDCALPRGRARDQELEHLDIRKENWSPYVNFQAAGILHYGRGASVFGVVEPVKKVN